MNLPSSARPTTAVPTRSRSGDDGGVLIALQASDGEADRQRLRGLPAPGPVLLLSRRRRLLGVE